MGQGPCHQGDDLSSVRGIHEVKREDGLPQAVLWSLCICLGIHTQQQINKCQKYKLVLIIIDDDTVLCISGFLCLELKIWLPPALATERTASWKESWSHRNRGSLKARPQLLSSLHEFRLRGVKSLSCLQLWTTWFISWLSDELTSSLLLPKENSKRVDGQRVQLPHLSVPSCPG